MVMIEIMMIQMMMIEMMMIEMGETERMKIEGDHDDGADETREDLSVTTMYFTLLSGIVMEYVEGGNLFELYKSCKRRSEHVKEGCIRVITQQENSSASSRSRVLCDMTTGLARVVFHALKIFDPPGFETVVDPRW